MGIQKKREQVKDNTHTILQSVKYFFSGTLISRVLGFGREVAMAAAFGTDPAVAAFWMAFRFSHLLRRVLGEGALNIAFIPQFETLRKEDPQKGALFFYQLLKGMTLLIFVLIVFLEAILGAFFCFGKCSSSTLEIVRLTMILLPTLLFISLYALNTSLLNCEQKYFLPSVAPSCVNGIWIITLLFVWQRPSIEALEILAFTIVFAFALQWFLTFPTVYRFLKKEKLGHQPFNMRALMLLLNPFLLAILGVVATQINTGIDTIFARIADPEGPAILWYAIRIQQLPLALFGVGLTGALLPAIARAVEVGRREQFLNFALKKNVTWMIPLTFGLMIFGYATVHLLYGRGAFTREALGETTRCLWAYGIGLFPMTAVLVLAASFYAQKNYKIPLLAALATIFLNLILNSFFVFIYHMGAVSVALATSISSCLNVFFLSYFISKEGGKVWAGIGSITIKVVIASLGASILTLLVGRYGFQDIFWMWIAGKEGGVSFILQGALLGVEGILFVGSFLLFGRGLKIPGLLDIVERKKERG